jgi:uncharacterized Zn-finger protein
MKTRNHVCSYQNCHKSFRSEDELQEHYEVHKPNEIKLSCNDCQKIFPTKQGLVEHSYTHSSKKKFRCSVIGCRKAFKQNSQLCNHRRMHRGVKAMIAKNDEAQQQTQEYIKSLAKALIVHDFSDLHQENNPTNDLERIN